MAKSTLFTGASKFILPFNNGKAKLEFCDDARKIRIFLPSDIQIAPFETLKIYVNIILHVSQFVDFQQNKNSKNVLFTIPIT